MFQLERTAQLWGITGNLGGGKSLSAVQFAVDAMSRGYYVCSNITLNLDSIAVHYGEFTRQLYSHISLDDPTFDPFKLPCGSPRGSGGKKRVLIILDECAEWVDQYSSAKDPRISRLWSWLRHSSKRSQDVFIVVQRPDYLNKVIRILITRWIWVHDLAVYRIPVLKMRFPFCGGLVMRNIFDNMKNRIGAVSFASKSYWGRFYNTAECLNSDGSTYALEYEVPEVKRYGKFWLALLFAFSQLLLYCFSDRARKVFPQRDLYPDETPPILANGDTLSCLEFSSPVQNPPSASHPLAPFFFDSFVGVASNLPLLKARTAFCTSRNNGIFAGLHASLNPFVRFSLSLFSRVRNGFKQAILARGDVRSARRALARLVI